SAPADYNRGGGRGGLPFPVGPGVWHFTLGERSTLRRITFPPRRQLDMSSNIKYIGLDVHKEAITVAVRNGAGKLVMESIIETKAVTLVQLLQCVRGELHVTLEEGSWGIPCAGTQVYAPRYREEWLNKIRESGVRRRAELFYQHLDGLQLVRRQVRAEFLAESRKHKAVKVLRQIPCIGPVRSALLL